jgi:ABC-2 type transport system ATP-binding protein
VDHLVKTYDSLVAVDDLTFTVAEGEVVGLLGANGAGKTTVMHILLGLLTPTSGTVEILGRSPLRDFRRLAPRINFSSAYVQLPNNLSAEQNLRFFAELYGLPDPRAKVADLLDIFHLTARAGRPTGALSAGEQTRLNLCKSFLNDPDILFLDEPTASLDPDIAEKVRNALLLLRRRRRLTILYTSHNMNEVESLCDRVVFLHRGKKIVEGTPDQVRGAFRQESLEKVFLHIARGGDVKDPRAEEGEE